MSDVIAKIGGKGLKFRVLYVKNYTSPQKVHHRLPAVVVVTNMSYANIIIRMRDCVRTNIYGQIESVLTRQEPLAPIPTTLQTAFPRKISDYHVR